MSIVSGGVKMGNKKGKNNDDYITVKTVTLCQMCYKVMATGTMAVRRSENKGSVYKYSVCDSCKQYDND